MTIRDRYCKLCTFKSWKNSPYHSPCAITHSYPWKYTLCAYFFFSILINKKIRVEYKFYIFILNANQQNIFFSNIYCRISGVVGEKTELTVEDKYKRTMEEIESLKVELGIFICTTKEIEL